MTTFFIADTHFGHKNIITMDQGEMTRHFLTIEEHDEEIIRRWNDRVRKNDIVWHLGDVAFGSRNIATVGRLNGHKRLVMGNHDQYPSSEYLKFFDKLYGAATIEGFILTHIPVHYDQLKRFGRNIHGHLHSKEVLRIPVEGSIYPPEPDPRYINVSCEQIDMLPVSLEEIKSVL